MGQKENKEPFPSVKTPNPPQVIDPSVRTEKGHPVEKKDKKAPRAAQEKSEKRLGESPVEIDDETTI